MTQNPEHEPRLQLKEATIVELFKDNLAFRHIKARIFTLMIAAAIVIAISLLGVLLWRIAVQGMPWLSVDFLTSFPSRFAARAGIKSALIGSLAIIVLTAIFSVILGLGAAVYLEELAPRGKLSRLIELNIANLAGVPSLVYGILGLAVFVRFLHFERSILAAGATLAIMILPIIVISAREALRTVPINIRMAALALGATPWQAVWSHVLPAAMPNILTGIILALSRALGEAAPLIIVGGVTYIAFLPSSLFDSFTTLPIQIFNWAGRPQEEFQGIAAAGIIVLLGVVLLTNSIAITLRNRMEKNTRW